MMWRMVHLAGAFYGFVAIVYCLILAFSQFGFAVELLLNASR